MLLEMVEEAFYRGPSRLHHVVKHPTAFVMSGSILHNIESTVCFDWWIKKREIRWGTFVF